MALACLCHKLDMETHPFEKHVAWLLYSSLFGASVGHMAWHGSALMRATNNELFVLWGYAMLYFSAYLF